MTPSTRSTEYRWHGPLGNCSSGLTVLLPEPVLFPTSTPLPTLSPHPARPVPLPQLQGFLFNPQGPTDSAWASPELGGLLFSSLALPPLSLPSLSNVAPTSSVWPFIALESWLVRLSNRIFVFNFNDRLILLFNCMQF